MYTLFSSSFQRQTVHRRAYAESRLKQPGTGRKHNQSVALDAESNVQESAIGWKGLRDNGDHLVRVDDTKHGVRRVFYSYELSDHTLSTQSDIVRYLVRGRQGVNSGKP